jgi:hypothetical protein
MTQPIDERALEAAARALSNACDCEQCMVVLRERARAAVTAYFAEAGDGWMPIETAPKDGTRVLLMLRGPKPPEMIARWTQAWTSEDDDPLEWINDEENAIYGTATHWHPLPAPPAAQDPRP